MMSYIFGGKQETTHNSVPHKPDPQKPTNQTTNIIPGINDTPLHELVTELRMSEIELKTLEKGLAKSVDDILIKGPVSPRGNHGLFSKNEPAKITSFPIKNDDKKSTAGKGLPFTETALEEMRKDTLEQTKAIANEIKLIHNGNNPDNPIPRLEVKLKKGELIRLCELNQTMATKYQNLLNRVQTTFKAWRVAEEVTCTVASDLRLLGSIAEVGCELIDRWLYDKVQENINLLFVDIRKVKRDIARAQHCVDVYNTPEDAGLLDLPEGPNPQETGVITNLPHSFPPLRRL